MPVVSASNTTDKCPAVANVSNPGRTAGSAAGTEPDWEGALAAYQAVRPEHCRRVVETSRAWGALWHLDGERRERRNAILRARDPHDYSFIDWLYRGTALTPAEEPEMFQPIPLDTPSASTVA